MKRLLTVVATLVPLLAAAPIPSHGQQKATPRRVVVKMMDQGAKTWFEPADVTVKPGDVLVFEQAGVMPHNVQFLKEGAPSGFDLGAAMMGPFIAKMGDVYEVKVDARFKPGKYPYQCTPHIMLGMKGVITVQP